MYHATTKPIARSAGRSAVAAAAYRSGSELVDERTGLVHDYTRKGGVVSAEIIAPDGGSAERGALWNAAELAENRKDSRTAREWIVALPAELDAGQRRELAVSFGAELARRYGVAVDVAIHEPDREGDNRNHHAHILTTTRRVSRGAAGELVMGDKSSIELADKKRRELGLGPAADEVKAIRQLWEQTANRALERAGSTERIDARSLKDQGIDREATTHLGPVASEMERRGRISDRGDGNRQVMANNEQRQGLTAQIIDLKTERERRAKARQVEALPAADLVKAWDGRKAELYMGYRQRAERLESRVDQQIQAISTKRRNAEANHAKKRPVEPTGLLAAFKRSSYEKLMTEWCATAKRIKAWKVGRENDLRKRLERVRCYLTPGGGFSVRDAERTLQKERPEWAARLPQARDEVQREKEAKKQELLAQKRERQSLQKGRPGRGGHGL
ncbi:MULTISPECIES: MobQ family relaxase [Pseudomonas chlororaphis group]|uniref:MobQ family relaxase n=1 Tax=Pseudomonas chlororaphis group TaxID=136842 RepID=UPI0024B332BE|nr:MULTISPECIES: MobQ family relaxase [Pseudomonas chlororaphis group]